MLQDHPVVVGACVVGVPDQKVGERIKAIVVMKEDAKGVGATELIRFCRDRLAGYKVPSYIEFRDMLPKSKVGKLLRREIRDEERRRQEKGKDRLKTARGKGKSWSCCKLFVSGAACGPLRTSR